MSDYTPTIKAVRDAYAYAAHDPSEDDPDSDEHYREFDRWKAQNDAEVAERALRRAARTNGALNVNTGGIYMDGRTWLNERADTAAREIEVSQA